MTHFVYGSDEIGSELIMCAVWIMFKHPVGKAAHPKSRRRASAIADGTFLR